MKKVLVDNRVGSILSGGGAAPVPNNPESVGKNDKRPPRDTLSGTPD